MSHYPRYFGAPCGQNDRPVMFWRVIDSYSNKDVTNKLLADRGVNRPECCMVTRDGAFDLVRHANEAQN